MATEDRWHDFAKEKPSEDMEGRNFIVSNGYSDTLSMWCGGYWENEPFMGSKLCDEVVRWKGYLTPEEEKANEATRTELKSYSVVASSEAHNYINGEINLAFEAYDIDEVDAFLTDKNKEIEELKQKLAEKESWVKMLGEGEAALSLELEKTKQKLEDAKASAYADSVDAGMENRKLKRALWLTRAERANEIHYMWCQFIYDRKYGIVKFNAKKEWGKNVKQGQTLHTPQGWADVWEEVERKCIKKAEEYK